MVTFIEVKELLGKIIGCRDITSDGDIVAEVHIPTYRESAKKRKITISNAELQALYDKVSQMEADNLELYTSKEYEIAIEMERFAARRQELPITIKDNLNGVEYALGEPSAEYSLYLLTNVKNAMNRSEGRNNRIPPMRLRRSMFMIIDESEDYSLDKILCRIIGGFSLKIKSLNEEPKAIAKFKDMKTAFEFEYMYKTGSPLIEFIDIFDMFPMSGNAHRGVSGGTFDAPPLRKYSEDVVDYYKQALASNDPYIKYISFYHVMEYFYDEVFKRKLVTDLKDKLTHPDFSYKDDEKIYEMASFVKNRMQMNNETGQGNELESLKYVLSEYVHIDELKKRINAISGIALNYYQESKVTFCNAPVIGWTDSQGIYTQIAKRIYYTRNSLVHSKSGKNQSRYRPYQDEKKLQMEIPLAQAVAEAIIINSSDIA